MSVATKPCQTTEQLQEQFLALVPRIETHARIQFRCIQCRVRRDDAIQECVALAWQWFVRLQQRGKDINQFVMVFVYLVVKAVKSGRRLVGIQRLRDVMNERCQRKNGFKMEPLPSPRTSFDVLLANPHGQEMQDVFEERLQDNRATPIPDQVAFRLDWPPFFSTLPARDRKMAAYLALGHNARKTSARFGVSPGRVTQLRQRWRQQWRDFQGDGVLV